jgi:hypothetical protein
MRLIAPPERDPRKWPDLTVMDMHDGREYKVTTDIDKAVPGRVVLVKSYRQVMYDYVAHPETKYDGADCEPCASDTRGRLQPCHIVALAYQHITKDSSSVTTANEAYTHMGPGVYTDDLKIRVLSMAKHVLREHKMSRRKLATATGTTEDQARGFLSANASRLRAKAEVGYVMYAVKLAKKDLAGATLFRHGADSPGQVLARWHQWKRLEVIQNEKASALSA